MNFKTIYLSSFIPIIIISFISCNQQKTEWKGMIEDVDGVKVVKNPKEPMYGEEVFVLEEEISIGEAEGPEEYMFSELRQIEVDEDDRIYILDQEEEHINVFDKEGKYLRTIGRKGRGPGELTGASLISVYQNELMVTEQGLTFFSLDGKFLRHILSKEIQPMRARFGSKDHIIFEELIFDPENPRFQLKKFDLDMNLISEIASSPAYDPRKPYNPFTPYTYWLIDKDENIVYGFQPEYELKVYNQEGKLLKKIITEYDPVVITDEEKEERTKGLPSTLQLNIPKYHFAFYRFFLDDGGRIFVQTFEKVGDEEIYYHDVYGPEGKYIAKIPLRMRPFVCKKNRLYSIEEDEEGFQVVKRYKVTWKN